MAKAAQSSLIGASSLKQQAMNSRRWSMAQVSLQGIGHLLANA